MAAKMILPVGTKAPDANLLDGIDSTKFTQEGFGKIKVGTTEINADSSEDVLEITNGANVSIVPDAVNDKITISVEEDTEHRFVSDQKMQTWDLKQDAIGYTPINKTGDTMTGELEVPSINLGGHFRLAYDPNTDSIVIGVD